MRNIYTAAFALLVLLALNLQSGDRMVIIERFTSSTCPPCASNNPIMDAFLSSQDADKIIGISYHMNWPAPGNDPMYLYNPNDNNTRRSYYGVNSIPQAKMDGIVAVDPPYSNASLTSFFNSRTNILSPVTVVVTDSTFGDSIRVRARIYCEVYLPNPLVTVHFAIMEKHIHYSSPPGTNGETDFYDVMRRMMPNGSGSSVILLPGQTVTLERTIYKDPLWQPAEIKPVVFVQMYGGEIATAAAKTNNFTIIPITGYKSVLQGQNQSATYQMTIPVVAAGYNSPVTLTAQVEPSNAGVTVSFPNGSVVNSFPATFNVQVNSTSSVPLGEYRIIVTGTNTNNKVHKTSVAYLVGKNYISVSSTRPQLTFAVDGVIHSSTKLFLWDVGAPHTLSAVSPQTFGSTRYLFQSWSDNGDSSHSFNVNVNTSSYSVNYRPQYKMLGSVSPSGIQAAVTGAGLFYDSAATFTITVNPASVMFNGKMYYFQNWAGTGQGSYSGNNLTPQITMHGIISQQAVFDTIVPFGIQNLNTGVPKEFALHQNYPNPFNPVTKIQFDVPKSSDVKLVVYDLLGSEIETIVSNRLDAGFYEADLDFTNRASGVYIYRLEAGSYTSVRRMILIK